MQKLAKGTHQPSGTYRADIDGLRAIAVVSVIAFHAFPGGLPGGYVGVDIFFVISGFLITSILIDQFEEHRYSLTGFYARRIRRIFPALAIVLATSLAFGWIALLPDEYAALGRHVAGGAGFVSNILLKNEAGYFDTSASMKPLLHLWSLGVEEQFYMLWPVVLYAAWRFRVKRIGVIAVLATSSFAYCIWLSHSNLVSAFYLPTSRFWELLVGAALAAHRNLIAEVRRVPKLANLMSSLGLVSILATTFLLPSHATFPGWLALPPTLGAAMIILAGPDAWVNRKALSHPGSVAVGLISYPLYLWHWPVLAYSNILFAQVPPPPIRVGLLVATTILAVLTYRLVELPLRFGGHVARKTIFLCASVFLSGALGYGVLIEQGLPDRAVVALNSNTATMHLGHGVEFVDESCGIAAADASLFEWCYSDKRETPVAAIWGDSHANALYWGFVRNSTSTMRWLHIGRPSCPPMLGSVIDPDCDRANKVAMARLVDDPDIKVIVITGAKWAISDKLYPTDIGGAATHDYGEAGLALSIAKLTQAHKRVVFVMDNPRFPDPKECLTSRLTSSELLNTALKVRPQVSCSMTLASFRQSTAEYRQMVDRLKSRFPEMLVFDPTPLLCDENAGQCSMWRGRDFLYSYGDHISDVANGLIASHVLPLIGSSNAAPSTSASPR